MCTYCFVQGGPHWYYRSRCSLPHKNLKRSHTNQTVLVWERMNLRYLPKKTSRLTLVGACAGQEPPQHVELCHMHVIFVGVCFNAFRFPHACSQKSVSEERLSQSKGELHVGIWFDVPLMILELFIAIVHERFLNHTCSFLNPNSFLLKTNMSMYMVNPLLVLQLWRVFHILHHNPFKCRPHCTVPGTSGLSLGAATPSKSRFDLRRRTRGQVILLFAFVCFSLWGDCLRFAWANSCVLCFPSFLTCRLRLGLGADLSMFAFLCHLWLRLCLRFCRPTFWFWFRFAFGWSRFLGGGSVLILFFLFLFRCVAGQLHLVSPAHIHLKGPTRII